MKKYILSAFLILFIAVALNPSVQLRAAEQVTVGSCGMNIDWTLTDDGVLYLKGSGDMQSPVIMMSKWESIPKKVVIGQGITSICSRAFPYAGITEVQIPDSVTQIESNAFEKCGVKKLNIPDSVKEIGGWAFADCSNLTEVNLPNEIKVIKEGTFAGCNDLTRIQIPDSVEIVEKRAFYSMYRLEEISLGSGITTIGDSIFEKSNRIRKIENRSGVTFSLESTKILLEKVTWSVNGEETTTVFGHTTMVGKGKEYKLTYRLNGAKVKGKLKKSYEYGSEFSLPQKVKKKGYVFSGWNVISPKNLKKGKSCVGLYSAIFDSLYLKAGDKVLIPRFYKVKIKKKGKNTASVCVDMSKINTIYFDSIVIRYATNPKMKKCKYICKTSSNTKKKLKFTLNKLKKKKYYVDVLLACGDDFSLEEFNVRKIPDYDDRLTYRHR